ncbi:hypothetical protein BDD43_4640 [Mucilaginibacter gracilis]|uniref:Uncharacterized protein n=1 Tax=Mucilaginibacter gracilis TaxID=423350 RepID=A0A495J600_9SPHI|nr:hypothetical protein [Mucilaginibacter gracilis]RKR84405.1 hypothetical protein BDD43_4640 [Mucilaginibacter gracilis]
MQDFKKFILQIQTLVIADNIVEANKENSLAELREFALIDILNLPKEQVVQQVKYLESVYEIFVDFWVNYDTIPDYTRQDHQVTFFQCLELEEYFIVIQNIKVPSSKITEQLLHDLLEIIKERQKILRRFMRAIENVIEKAGKAEARIEIKQGSPKHRFKNNPSFKFKTEIITDLFNLLKDYFAVEEQAELLKLLQITDTEVGKLLLFNGNGNQLADAFKQLFESNLIQGCNKAELNLWVLNHFFYKDKDKQRNYTEKYLNDIISSDTKVCQSPILDVKKREGGEYGIFPTQRIKKNYNKY